MEEQTTLIKETSRCIVRAFYGLWAAAIVLWILFETGLLPMGVVDGRSQVIYYTEIVSILVALALIPVSLKCFHRYVLTLHRDDEQQDSPISPTLFRAYRNASLWRLAGIGFPFFFNLLLYFLTLNRTPGMVALIALLATIFCIPDKKRLINELNLPEQ